MLHVAADGAAMARHAVYADEFQSVFDEEADQGPHGMVREVLVVNSVKESAVVHISQVRHLECKHPVLR